MTISTPNIAKVQEMLSQAKVKRQAEMQVMLEEQEQEIKKLQESLTQFRNAINDALKNAEQDIRNAISDPKRHQIIQSLYKDNQQIMEALQETKLKQTKINEQITETQKQLMETLGETLQHTKSKQEQVLKEFTQDTQKIYKLLEQETQKQIELILQNCQAKATFFQNGLESVRYTSIETMAKLITEAMQEQRSNKILILMVIFSPWICMCIMILFIVFIN